MFAQTRRIVDLRDQQVLLESLAECYEDFAQRAANNPAFRLKDLRILHLRGPRLTSAPKGYAYGLEHTDCADRPIYEEFSQVRALVSHVLQVAGFNAIGNVMLSVMTPGTSIEPHFDPGLYFEYYHRIHVPIFTDPGCICVSLKYPISSGRQVEHIHLESGWAWELNNCDYHWFYHWGARPRFHIVFDAR